MIKLSTELIFLKIMFFPLFFFIFNLFARVNVYAARQKQSFLYKIDVQVGGVSNFFVLFLLRDPVESEEYEAERDERRGNNTYPHKHAEGALLIKVNKEVRIDKGCC